MSNLPKGWLLSSLGDVCTQPQYGYTTSGAKQGSLRLLRTTDITSGKIHWPSVPFCEENPDDENKYLLEDGDIVISRAGSVGVSYLIKNPERAVFASYLIRFRPYINTQFFKYFLGSTFYWKQISENKLGIAVPNVNASKLQTIPIPIAPINEQRRIVAKIEEFFSELDKGIESLKTAREQLKVYRQAVLKHAFEGKLTADWRNKNKSKLKPADKLIEIIKSERETAAKSLGKNKLKEIRPLSEEDFNWLSELPSNWCWERLGWMTCGIEYGTGAKSCEMGDVPVLRMGNIQNMKFDWSDLVYTSDQDEIQGYSLKKDDVLFNRTNSPELVGKTAIYNGERPALFAGYLMRVNQIDIVVDARYLNFYLNSHTAKQYGNKVKTDGVNQSNINGEKLAHYPFPYCSLEEQKVIVSILESQISSIDRTEEDIDFQLNKAEALRQAILKKAFSGELVAQDLNDEPASLLLERIRAEKQLSSNSTQRRKRA